MKRGARLDKHYRDAARTAEVGRALATSDVIAPADPISSPDSAPPVSQSGTDPEYPI